MPLSPLFLSFRAGFSLRGIRIPDFFSSLFSRVPPLVCLRYTISQSALDYRLSDVFVIPGAATAGAESWDLHCSKLETFSPLYFGCACFCSACFFLLAGVTGAGAWHFSSITDTSVALNRRAASPFFP